MPSPRLAPYDPDWPHRYSVEVPHVIEALGTAIAAEHVGSTAVPGLTAKPTIDIAVGVPTLVLSPEAMNRMLALGYSYGGTHDKPQHVFRRGDEVPWQFLIHVVEHEGQMWCDFLRFRDHLRSHPEDAERYAVLKSSLLVGRDSWYRGDDKKSFIAPILAR